MQSHFKHALESGRVRFHSKGYNIFGYFIGQEALRPTSDEDSWVLQSTSEQKTHPRSQESENVGALEEIFDFGTGYA